MALMVDIPITEIEVDMIPLIIGLHEKPSTFFLTWIPHWQPEWTCSY